MATLARVNQLPEAYREVASNVLRRSLRLKRGETLTVETWTTGLHFAKEVVLQAKKLGAFPIVTYEDEKSYVRGVRLTPKSALGRMGRHELSLLAGSDAYVFIPGPPISSYYPKITRKEWIDSTGYNASWYAAAKKHKLRGARLTFGYVGNDLARLLGKSRDEIVWHQLNAATVDLAKISIRARELAGLLRGGHDARLLTEGCELKLRLMGEVEIQDGITDEKDIAEGNNICYVPPGYVGKGVKAASADGSLRASPSLTRHGMVEDVEIRFSRGKFAGWSSKSSTPVLKSLEEVLPASARSPNYIMIGLNPLMKFGYGQDRFPAGSITVSMGIGVTVRKGTLYIDGKVFVKEGRLA